MILDVNGKQDILPMRLVLTAFGERPAACTKTLLVNPEKMPSRRSGFRFLFRVRRRPETSFHRNFGKAFSWGRKFALLLIVGQIFFFAVPPDGNHRFHLVIVRHS